VDLNGTKVLEVRCGHGGGASYIKRYLGPASHTGLDLNPSGIAFGKKRHTLPGLDFVQGDAQHLPFPDQSFDAVVNVESANYYPDQAAFFSEVARVLRPGRPFPVHRLPARRRR
jgi:fatty-acid O-methyltransferase